MNVVEIEVATGKNANLFFRPLSKNIRGEFNARDFRDKEMGELLASWPEPIPGQRIGLDLETGTAYVAEPLHEDRHEALRNKIGKSGFGIPKAKEAYQDVHVATWLYWLKSAVESGHAKVVKGALPETIEGDPKLDFITRTVKTSNEQLADAINRQTAALERQAGLFERLITALASKK